MVLGANWNGATQVAPFTARIMVERSRNCRGVRRLGRPRLDPPGQPPDPVALRHQAEAFMDSPAKVDALAELAKLEWQTDPDAALRHGEEGLRIGRLIGQLNGDATEVQKEAGKFIVNEEE